MQPHWPATTWDSKSRLLVGAAVQQSSREQRQATKMGTETVQQPPACSKRTRFNVKQKLWKVALLFCFVLFFALLKMWLDFFFGRMDRDGTEGRPSIFTEVLPPDLILHCWTPKMLFLTTPQVATVICSYICRNLYVQKNKQKFAYYVSASF